MAMMYAITTTTSRLGDTEPPMMPPPQNILRQGTREFEDAVTSGEIELSLPHQDSLSWMNNNRESTSSFSLGSSSNKKRNYHMTREDGMKENLCDTNNVAGEDCNPHHEEEASCSAGQHQDKNNNNHDQNEFSDASVATGGNAKGDDKDPPTEFSRAKTSKGQVSIRFSDIVGHGAVKLRLDEVLLPMALPPALADSILTGVRSLSASILLFGPPGCGKTQLAKAIAGEAQAFFMSVSPSDVLSKFVGDSEAAIRSLFDKAYKQAQNMESRCTILFFDEIDALGQSRGSSAGISDQGGGGDGCSRRVLAELLIQMNRINSSSSSNKKSDFLEPEEDDHSQSSESGESVDTVYENEPSSYMEESDASIEDSGLRVRVIVVAATNRPEDCDPALVRRFSVRVMVGLPTQRDRKRILKQYLTGIDHNIPPKQLHEIALSTDGWSGSDLESLTREAAMAPVRECIRSAALIKRRIPQRERREGDSSCQNDDQAGAGNCPHIEARDKLLEQFRNLRQVNFQDFNEAISFWTGNHYQSSDSITNPSMDQTSSTKRMVHYDSSSDEED